MESVIVIISVAVSERTVWHPVLYVRTAAVFYVKQQIYM